MRVNSELRAVVSGWRRKLSKLPSMVRDRLASKPANDNVSKNKDTVVILATNDIHANVYNPEEKSGIAYLATAIRQERAENPNTILVDAGDAISAGDAIVQVMKGWPMVKIMNKLKYDAVTLGNHEFDYGYKHLIELMSKEKFPVVSANVIIDSEKVKPYIIKEVGGHKIGILGVTTDQMIGYAPSTKTQGVTFLREELLGSYIRELKEKNVDLIVVLSHSSHDGNLSRDIELARQFPDIDIIIAGHSHDTLEKPIKVGKTYIVEGGKSARNLMKLVIDFTSKGPAVKSYQLLPSSKYEPASDIVQVLKEAEKLPEASKLEEVIGNNEVYLWRSSYEQSPMGTLFTEAVLEAAPKADAALCMSGVIRDELKEGKVKVGDIFRVAPFEDELMYVELTGKQLKDLIELGFRDRKKDKRKGSWFFQQSGLRIYWTDSKSGPKVLDIYKRGSREPIKDNEKVRIVVQDVLADVIAERYGVKPEPVGKRDTDVFIEFVRKHLAEGKDVLRAALDSYRNRYIYVEPRETENLEKVNNNASKKLADVPVNPVEYAKKYNTGFILLHGPHNPFDAMEKLDMALKRDVSFELDINTMHLGRYAVYTDAHDVRAYKLKEIENMLKNVTKSKFWREVYSKSNIRTDDLYADQFLKLIEPKLFLDFLKNSKAPIKFDLKTPEAIDYAADQLLPKIDKRRVVVHMFLVDLVQPGTKLKPYQTEEMFTMYDLERVRRRFGDVPIFVTAQGITRDKINRELLDKIGQKLKGKAQVFSFNLPNGEAPPAEAVKYLWDKYGIMTEIPIKTPADAIFWLKFAKRNKVPFIGLTNDIRLATPVGVLPEENEKRLVALSRYYLNKQGGR